MGKKDAYLHYFLLFAAIALFLNLPSVACVDAASLPGIISGPENRVPDCVTPERLMEFVLDRNRALLPPRKIDPRFSDVASLYKLVGECVEGSGRWVHWSSMGLRLLPDAGRNQLSAVHWRRKARRQ